MVKCYYNIVLHPITLNNNTMDQLLTTKQVQDLFKIDRITVYRMLNDGRIKGVKVGNQWRFARAEIDRMLGEPIEENGDQSSPVIKVSDFPVDCVEKLQGIFAGILGVGAITVNLNGEALTQPIFSNPFCKMMLSNPSSQKACQESWRKIAMRVTGNPDFHVCHAGLCYMRSSIKMDEKTVAWMVTGQFYITPHSADKAQNAINEVVEKYHLNREEVEDASQQIPVLKHTQQEQVQEWAPRVTSTVQSMLCERSDLVNRLEQIAAISTIHPSLKNNTVEKGD
jgi:excisionase family DNA binding protein